MYEQCSRKKWLVAFIFFTFGVYREFCDGTILSKGKITMCVKDKNSEPFNVVDEKSCDKKLVITKSVSSGQKESEMIYVNVSKVRDEVNRDEARLYNPFIITITSSPMYIIYPYYLIGTVNNKPYETSRREYWCQDGARTSDDDDFSCKVQYDVTTGTRIWDSQGFCCRCSIMEDFHDTQGGRYHRGDAVCGNSWHIPLFHQWFKNKKRQSAHCMNYDKLWYNVHKIGLYKIWFKIFVKAYDLVEEERDGKRYQKMVDGGQIELSNFKTSGHGVHGRLLASIIGMFETDTQIYSLTERYLFIPAGGSNVNRLTHPQTRNGARDFMIIPRSLVAMDNRIQSCNMIGVSFTAFRMQGGYDGQGPGCTRKIGSCLHNQVKDYFETDVKRRKQGKRPIYFPERFGHVVGTGKYDSSGKYALIYKAGKLGNIMISLEISADDIILIYNKAGGIIVKAFATDFESLSQDGLLHVIVQNTGFVTADYFVTMKYCTRGMQRSPEVKASINAQSVHTFTFQLRTTIHASGQFMCSVNLWDARHGLLDSANITFETTTACVCLQSCSCACIGHDTETCITDIQYEVKEAPELENKQLQEKVLGSLEQFFVWLNENFSTIVDLFTKPTLSHCINLWILFSLLFGLLKAGLGMQAGGGPIAYFGWWWEQPTGQKLFIDANGDRIMGMYNRDGDLLDPTTGEVLKSEKLVLFVGNVLFFLLSIFILGVHTARYYKLWVEQNKMAVSLSSVALTETPVYRNFTGFEDGESILTNPGENFSLVGKLERVELEYKFIISESMQVVEVVDDEILLLNQAIPFNPKHFVQTFTEQKALEEITLEPMYVCLNEEPEFEFYEENANDRTCDVDIDQDASACSSSSDLPPKPPPRDYSRHDIDTLCSQEIYDKDTSSCSEGIYEESISPYASPVNEYDQPSMSGELE